ncbi:MAG TPA: glycosyl hydrolase family 79 C-terminal domain-containing protein [Candidatus Saccharimonadales bacterium]|nr:glycosyl hydrolase family 79 C-terminal domain-containing protein [Candidatus Saccharimonadales bacterium]
MGTFHLYSKIIPRLALVLRGGSLIFAGLLAATTLMAQSPVIVKVDILSPGDAIPDDYSGASYETVNLKSGSSGISGYFFDSTNSELVTLFKQLGTKCLRIGGSTVDGNGNFTPANRDMDALFRFAQAAGVKVIFSVRLFKGDAAQDASAAKYIWDNYRQYLDCFSIGNEPEMYRKKDPDITDYPTYLAKWRTFASAITNVVPKAKFGGPDSGPGRPSSWGTRFASDEAGSGIVKSIYFHYYVGGGSRNLTIPTIIDSILSTNWVSKNYPATYAATGGSILSTGYPYRFTEANSYYTGGGTIGIAGGNNCYATALFALDFMHWWALHGCSGVNFHTTMHPTNWWKYNGTIYRDAQGNFQVRPMGYGIKAFDLGGHGHVEPVTLTNANLLNLTAYAVGDGTNVYVTLINKEHDTGARSATVTIMPNGVPAGSAAEVMFLTAPSPSATNGVTLGGAPIPNHGAWRGQWMTLGPVTDGQCTVTVPAASAAIVRINARHLATNGN